MRQLNEYETWYQGKFQEVTDHPDDHPTFCKMDGLFCHYKQDPLYMIWDEQESRSWKLVPASMLIPKVLQECMMWNLLDTLESFGCIRSFLPTINAGNVPGYRILRKKL